MNTLNQLSTSLRRYSLPRRSFRTLLLAALALPLAVLQASAQTLDQQQLQYNGGTSARTLPGYTVWQSFTAGITGTLTEIDMGFFNNMSGKATLQVFSGQGTSGPLLQSLTVPITGITQPAVTWNAWTVQVPVTAGSVYTFNIIPDATTLPDPYGVCIGSGNPYAAGTMGLNDPSGSYTTSFDVVFRTYVTTGQPAPHGLVVPGIYANTPAEMQVAGGAGGHYQQVFSSSEFWPAAETHTIRALGWRLGSALPPGTYSWTISQFEVYVCTTDKAVNGLSTLYADNYNAATDRIRVYSGPITFTGTVGAAGSLNTFDVQIPFQTPFAYTPSKGNLLIDVIGYDFYENLWNRQVDLAGSSSVTSYLWGDWRYADGALNGFGGAGLVTEFITDTTPVPPPAQAALSGLSLAPTVLYGGESSTGTVTLAGPAATGGQSVSLGSNNGSASLPSSILVPEGQSSTTFTINTAAVTVQSLATITASSGGVSISSALTLNPSPVPSSLTISPASLTGGSSASGTLTLSSPAPAGGQSVTLASSSTAASVPTSVFVAEGASSASFTILTTQVSSTATANITASSGGGSTSAVLTINPAPSTGPSLYNLSISSSMRSNSKTTGKIEITQAAPAGGVTVQLSSSNAAVLSVPPTVFIAAGKKQASFTVNSAKVTKATTVVVTGTLGSSQKTVSVTVNP